MAETETKIYYYILCWYIALILCHSQDIINDNASNQEYYYVSNIPDQYPAPNLKILIATSIVVSIIIVVICVICFRKNRYTSKHNDSHTPSISLPNISQNNSIIMKKHNKSKDMKNDEELQQTYHDFIIKKLSDSNSVAKNDEIDDDSIGISKTHLHTKKFSDIMREYNSVSTTHTKQSIKSKNSNSLQSYEVSARSSNYNSINNQSDSDSKADTPITQNNNNNNSNNSNTVINGKQNKSFIGNIFNKFNFKKRSTNNNNDNNNDFNYESEPLSGVSIVYHNNSINNNINSDSEYIRKKRINSVSGLPKPPERLKPLKERGSISVNRTNIMNVNYISRINKQKKPPKPPPKITKKRKKPPPPPRI